MVKKHKQIMIRLETYEALTNLGTMKDTFDSVINRLMKDAEKWEIFKKEILDQPSYIDDPFKPVKQWFKNRGLLE